MEKPLNHLSPNEFQAAKTFIAGERSQWLSTLDLKSGYWQVGIYMSDQKTAITIVRDKRNNTKPHSLADLIRVGLAEFFGTALLVFLSCTGCTMGVQGDISTLHVSMAAGLSLVVIIQMFGHISGAHVNPVVTMAALIHNEVSTKQVPVYVISQILGCLTGSGFHKLLTPNESYSAGNSTVRGICVNAPHGNLTEWQALGVEIILTFALVIAICATWDEVNSNKMDSVPLRIGLIILSLNVSAGAYTGASMNPARSLGPAVWTNDYTSHWIYWVGPTIGSLIAAYFYKYVFLRRI